MITYAHFGKLELEQFVPESGATERHVYTANNGEQWDAAYSNTIEWFVLQSDSRVRTICMYFDREPVSAVNELCAALDLPLKPGMLLHELHALFGLPQQTMEFVETQDTFIYIIGDNEPFYLALTVHKQSGLRYAVCSNHSGMLTLPGNARP